MKLTETIGHSIRIAIIVVLAVWMCRKAQEIVGLLDTVDSQTLPGYTESRRL